MATIKANGGETGFLGRATTMQRLHDRVLNFDASAEEILEADLVFYDRMSGNPQSLFRVFEQYGNYDDVSPELHLEFIRAAWHSGRGGEAIDAFLSRGDITIDQFIEGVALEIDFAVYTASNTPTANLVNPCHGNGGGGLDDRLPIDRERILSVLGSGGSAGAYATLTNAVHAAGDEELAAALLDNAFAVLERLEQEQPPEELLPQYLRMAESATKLCELDVLDQIAARFSAVGSSNVPEWILQELESTAIRFGQASNP